ncbi:chitosanase [Streptomyces sp. NPDC002644]
MARHLFGGSAADVAESITGARVPNAEGTLWDGPDPGSTQLTDLTNIEGIPITVITANPQGMIPRFYGPNNVDVVWADFGAGRVILTPVDLGERLSAHEEYEDPHGSKAYLEGKLGVPNGIATLDGQGRLKGSQMPSGGGGGGGAASSSHYVMTGPTTIPLPSVTPVDGAAHRIYAAAPGGAVTATFASGYRLTDMFPSASVTVPEGQILIAAAEYSSLVGAWVLNRRAVTTGSGGSGSGSAYPPSVTVGSAETLNPSVAFARTATEVANGANITSRSWRIQSGPMGTGTTVSNAAAINWIPGDSPLGTNDIRQPVVMEMAFEITSTAENSTLNWTSAYPYIEDIGDDRGYTAGLVGFTSATGDMLSLVQKYAQMAPGNLLQPYIPGLQACASVGFGPGASQAAQTNLGANFIRDWQLAANGDPLFRRAQREYRKEVYWDPALANALTDGVGPLGMALHYDILVNHGPGNDPESYGGIVAAARASTAKPPSQGGSEAAYLTKLCDLRDAVLQGWGDFQSDGRSTIFRHLITVGNLTLTGNVTFSVYGSTYSFNRPAPPADARIGTYVLRYTAINSAGSTSADVSVTVQDSSSGGSDLGMISTLRDDFNDNVVNASIWANNFGTPTPDESGGRARLPCGTDWCAYKSASVYKLEGSGIFAKLTPPAKSTATDEAYVAMTLESATGVAGTNLSVMVDSVSNTIRFSINTDYWDNNALSLPYNSTTHAWVRIRESAGSVYWDTSSDGVTWTQRRSAPTPTWAKGATNVAAVFESHRDAGTLDYSYVDNVNTLP